MYLPLLAACAAATLIAFAPMTAPSLSDALDVSDLFQPLKCAMAHSGSCALGAVHRDRVPARKVPSRPLIAAADLG